MTEPHNPYLMSDEDFEALEEVLTSDIVPEDCMDLEMLDGFLAGVLISPRPIPVERWLPDVWSAHGEEASFSGGRGLQRAIRLVKAYYNEMVSTLGLDDDDEICWEPFCFAIAEGDTLKVGEEWLEGFAQGLDLWPQGWEEGLDEETVTAVRDTLDEVLAPWAEDSAAEAGEETRLEWLGAMGEAVNDIYAHWRDAGIPAPALLEADAPREPAAAGPGRNDPCPCGSGKKFKKCCGALDDGGAA
ncbi:YecA/YgfB family protein [Thauera butanivorans]|uniref:YecA/YgfB family protein n=1 Tax=Thauera butanivorans TaxID=86174 RepID=UPI0008395710|nr:YecA family protein [Thauera butanivorans]